MRRAILGGLAFLLVTAADAGATEQKSSDAGARPIAAAPQRKVNCPQYPFDKIDGGMAKNKEILDRVEDRIAKIETLINELKRKSSENDNKTVCTIDERDKIFDEIKRIPKGDGSTLGLALAGAGLGVSVLTMLLMGIWAWSWHKSLPTLLRRKEADGITRRLQAMEELLQKIDRQPPASTGTEPARPSAPPSSPPLSGPVAPRPAAPRPVAPPDSVAEFVADYNRFLGPTSPNESISDLYEQYAMHAVRLGLGTESDHVPAQIRRIKFYGYKISDDVTCIVPDIVIFDDLYSDILHSPSMGYGLDDHINKYFEIQWSAKPRLIAPLRLGPDDKILSRGSLQLPAK